MNNKGEFDLESMNWMAVVLALAAGLFSIVIVKRMDGGLFLKIITFIVTTIACYIIAWKVGDSG